MSLQGTIETFAIADVLRLLAATSKSGRLQVQGPDRSGTVWVDGGKVLAAESPSTPRADGVADVLFQLVRFDRGSFSFELDRHPPQPGQPVDIEAALGEAEEMVSEFREIERRVPSAETWVGLRSELPDDQVTVTSEQWRVVRAVGGGRSVAGIGDFLGLGELPALRAVDGLLGLGLVEVGPEAPDAGPDSGSDTTASPEGTGTGTATLDAAGALGAGASAIGATASGASVIGEPAVALAPSEGEARRRLDALAGEYGLPPSPPPPPSPPASSSAPSTTFPAAEPTAPPPLPATGDMPATALRTEPNAGSDVDSGSSVAFPPDTRSDTPPHGDPLVGGTAAPSASAPSSPTVGNARANPPAPPGYDDGGYGQPSFGEYDQGAYAAYGEYGQQAQPGYGDAGSSPLSGYGTPPPPGDYGDYYGDTSRSQPPPPPEAPGADSWAPPAPSPGPLAPDWTSTGRFGQADEPAPGLTAEGGPGAAAGGWPGEGVPRARTIFESSAPPPPPPPPAPASSTFGTGGQWFDGGPERLAPPPPPPPPATSGGNGADTTRTSTPGGTEGDTGRSNGEDDASSLERQLQHLSPKAQEAIKRSSGLFEGNSPR